MDILITGKNGFIGRNLTEKLFMYNVTAVGRKELDLQDTKAVETYLQNHYFDTYVPADLYDFSKYIMSKIYDSLRRKDMKLI